MNALLLSAALLACSQAHAVTAEVARGEAASTFAGLAQSPIAAAPKTERVRVSGAVTLKGHGHVQRVDNNSVTLTLSGRASFGDVSGKVGSGQVDVTYTGTFRVANGRIDDKARPKVSVSLYRDGKYVGSAVVSGDFQVTGRLDRGWYDVSGTGTLSGDGAVRE